MVQIKLPYGTAHTPITISNDRPNSKNTTPAASMALGVPDLLSIVSFGLYSFFFCFYSFRICSRPLRPRDLLICIISNMTRDFFFICHLRLQPNSSIPRLYFFLFSTIRYLHRFCLYLHFTIIKLLNNIRIKRSIVVSIN